MNYHFKFINSNGTNYKKMYILIFYLSDIIMKTVSSEITNEYKVKMKAVINKIYSLLISHHNTLIYIVTTYECILSGIGKNVLKCMLIPFPKISSL